MDVEIDLTKWIATVTTCNKAIVIIAASNRGVVLITKMMPHIWMHFELNSWSDTDSY